MRIRIHVLIMLVLGSVIALASEEKSKMATSPAYEKMKTLAGSWEGTVKEGDKEITARARFQLISDGSAIAGWLDEKGPHEMVTMFHMDGKDVMATHYCAAHNQPRMVLVSGGDPNRLVFKFKDGTNIQEDVGYMNQVAFNFEGPDRHSEEWTYLEKGKEQTSRFDFRRKK